MCGFHYSWTPALLAFLVLALESVFALPAPRPMNNMNYHGNGLDGTHSLHGYEFLELNALDDSNHWDILDNKYEIPSEIPAALLEPSWAVLSPDDIDPASGEPLQEFPLDIMESGLNIGTKKDDLHEIASLSSSEESEDDINGHPNLKPTEDTTSKSVTTPEYKSQDRKSTVTYTLKRVSLDDRCTTTGSGMISSAGFAALSPNIPQEENPAREQRKWTKVEREILVRFLQDSNCRYSLSDICELGKRMNREPNAISVQLRVIWRPKLCEVVNNVWSLRSTRPIEGDGIKFQKWSPEENQIVQTFLKTCRCKYSVIDIQNLATKLERNQSSVAHKLRKLRPQVCQNEKRPVISQISTSVSHSANEEYQKADITHSAIDSLTQKWSVEEEGVAIDFLKNRNCVYNTNDVDTLAGRLGRSSASVRNKMYSLRSALCVLIGDKWQFPTTEGPDFLKLRQDKKRWSDPEVQIIRKFLVDNNFEAPLKKITLLAGSLHRSHYSVQSKLRSEKVKLSKSLGPGNLISEASVLTESEVDEEIEKITDENQITGRFSAFDTSNLSPTADSNSIVAEISPNIVHPVVVNSDPDSSSYEDGRPKKRRKSKNLVTEKKKWTQAELQVIINLLERHDCKITKQEMDPAAEYLERGYKSVKDKMTVLRRKWCVQVHGKWTLLRSDQGKVGEPTESEA